MTPPSLPQPFGLPPGDEHPHRAGVFALPAAPASVGMARRDVREWLTEWGIDPETRDNAILVTSELVTNALTHTASEWIVCRVHVAEERLHIEVEDQHRGWSLPAQRRPGPDDQGGRGLLLVGALSSDWALRHRRRLRTHRLGRTAVEGRRHRVDRLAGDGDHGPAHPPLGRAILYLMERQHIP